MKPLDFNNVVRASKKGRLGKVVIKYLEPINLETFVKSHTSADKTPSFALTRRINYVSQLN